MPDPILLFNDRPLPCSAGLTLGALLQREGVDAARVATAVNARFVPRDARATTPLQVDMIVADYGAPAENVHMIPPGYDDNRFYPVSESSRQMVRQRHRRRSRNPRPIAHSKAAQHFSPSAHNHALAQCWVAFYAFVK